MLSLLTILALTLLSVLGLIVFKAVASRFSKQAVKPPPLWRLHRLSKALFPTSAYEVFDTVYADVLHDYQEALEQKLVPRARWIHLRGSVCFLIVMAHQALEPIVQIISKVRKAAK